MPENEMTFSVSLARTDADIQAAQALRYQVFVEEMGASGQQVDHAARLERDYFDAFCDHLLITETRTNHVIGTYRLMRREQAEAAGRFYSETEYDLDTLKSSGRSLLEVGRSCLHPQFRGGSALFHLWSGLADYVATHRIDVLFGVASFPGTDLDQLAEPLSMLHHGFLAPVSLRCRSEVFQSMALLPKEDVDRKRAMLQIPALIKAYLRLGGVIGEGAYVDHSFNTTDVCMILDTCAMTDRQKRMFAGPQVEG